MGISEKQNQTKKQQLKKKSPKLIDTEKGQVVARGGRYRVSKMGKHGNNNKTTWLFMYVFKNNFWHLHSSLQ